MKYLVKDFGAYKLHLIKTDKFKTITTRVSFREPVVKSEITIRNILCDIFTQSTEKYPNKRSLTIKAQDLYAADIQATNSRLGNYITTDIYLSVLNDKYTEKGNFNSALEFLSEIIFHPDVNNGKFNKEKLDIVKTSCRDSLNSIKEDAAFYSLVRMLEEFDKKSPSSYRMIGYVEDLDNITEDNLYQYYLKMLNTNFIDIFIIGDICFDEVTEIVKDKFPLNSYKKHKVSYLLSERKPRVRKNVIKEKVSNSQSKLSIGCKVCGLSDYERNYPLTLYNVILGGGCDSKLFKKVREENSLCYTISSVPNKLDNLLIIRAGIDKNNYKKTIDVIEECVSEMKKGSFDDTDINIAKEYFNTALDDVVESPSRIIENYFLSDLIGTDTIEEKRIKMNKVTKEEIIEVAKKVKLDTIFLLEGDVDEGN